MKFPSVILLRGGEKGGRWQRQMPFTGHSKALTSQAGPSVPKAQFPAACSVATLGLIYSAQEIVKASQGQS